MGAVERSRGNFRASAEQYQIAARMDPSEKNLLDFGSSLLMFDSDAAAEMFRFGIGKYADSMALVAAVEETAARRPAGMMVVGWEPSALIPSINQAIESGIPVICVDSDVPQSKRLSFVGTDWFELGVKQGQEMVKALAGRTGKVAMIGLIEQYIDQRAFAGFRSVVNIRGIEVLDPQEDKGNQAEATRVATGLIQAIPDLAGIAGFDSKSGPGIGQAILETGKKGRIAATCVECEAQLLEFLKQGIINAAVCQKRALFTYQGLKALYEVVHSPIKFTLDDAKMRIAPIPVYYNTGTFVATHENASICKLAPPHMLYGRISYV